MFMLKIILGIFASFFFMTLLSAAEPKVDFSLSTPPPTNPGNNITISPDMIKSGSNSGTTNPPQNSSQAPGASKPGVVITIPLGGSGNK